LLHVRQVVTKGGDVREYGKTDGSFRAVPIAAKAVEAIHAHPTRMDSLLLFPTQRRRGKDWMDLHW
jgi:hypothetical protein